ncbi:glial cells missing related [Schistosoma mansoni]|uniref:glial cells missing related n=1 Tax=Schistosoma mansoni TaxID=6183 RepID=UPI00022C86EE|nr:glial cells missing related [Schistosoma mansoni]|eukprot:XP_018646253.1 glial cells missing related [Schistosoma mansoni]
MLDSNKFSSSEKQLNISETWNWANYDISLNNTNHNGNGGNIEQNKCLTNFPNSNHIHLPSIESVRKITYNNNNLNHSYNNESYSTCHYDHQHKPEYTLPPITYPNIEQYETDLRNLTKTNELNHTTTHNNNNLDQIVDYLPVIHTDTTITNYLVSSTPNPLIHLNQIDQYNLITCNELKGNDNSSNIIHDDKNIIDESKDNSSLTVQQHLWDIKDLKLPKGVNGGQYWNPRRMVNYYDSYELWPTGHCRRVYAQTCERARRHQSGWAMRNTNNHNPQVLKKSCLGVLECSMNCMVQGKPLSLRPAICDKARKKQCNRECITPGCKGRLILRNCRGHSGYPVTHFWRFANGAVYFEAKGEHDHNRPSLKTFDNSPLLSKTKHIGKRGTNRKGIRREKKLTNTYLKKQQKYENYYKKLSNESNCTLNDIKRNRKNQQNTRSDQINKFKIPIKTDENDNDPIFYDDPFHGDTIHNVIQCDPLTTSLSNLNGNESFFIQYNNCSYLNKPKYLSSSYNEYPQSVLINSMYRENDESNPVQFNDINNEICHSTPQHHGGQHYQQPPPQQQPTVQCSMNDSIVQRTEQMITESMEFINQDEYDIDKSFNYYHFLFNSNMHESMNMNCFIEFDKYGIVKEINNVNNHYVHENMNENSLHEEEDDDDGEEEEGEEEEEQVEDTHYNHPSPFPPPQHHHHHHYQQKDEFIFNQNLLEETTNWSSSYLHNSSLLPSSSSSSSSSKEQISQFEQDLTINGVKHHNFEECLPRTSNTSIMISTTTPTTSNHTTCNNNHISTTNNSNNNDNQYLIDHNFPCDIHHYDNSLNYFIVNEPVTITFDQLLINNSHF